TASQSFTWTVTQVLITNPGDRTNAEGDAVSLQLQAAASSGHSPTYSASGLPAGLTLNSSTGLISGTLANLSSNSSPYTVTVTATADSASNSQTFTWTVTHVLLYNPGDQTSTRGDTIALQVTATDPNGDPLTYSATGLPSGLSIASGTGLISGTIA